MNLSLRLAWPVILIALAACAALAVLGGLYVLPRVAPAAAAVSSLFRPGPAAPTVGRAAPDFALDGIDGKSIGMQGLRGKVVVLNFWATWCPPCIAEMGNLEKTHQQHPDDVVILGVNQGEKTEDVKGFTEIYRLSFPIALDRSMQVGDLYRVQSLPTTIFIDRQGKIAEIHIGGPMSSEFLEGRITGLLRK